MRGLHWLLRGCWEDKSSWTCSDLTGWFSSGVYRNTIRLRLIRREKNDKNEFPPRRGRGMCILGITFAGIVWLAFCLAGLLIMAHKAGKLLDS